MVNKSSSKPIVQQKKISGVQRLSTPAEEEKMGTNDARMKNDKDIQEKPIQQKTTGPEKEKQKGIHKKDNPEKEKLKGVQKMDDPEKEKKKPAQFRQRRILMQILHRQRSLQGSKTHQVKEKHCRRKL